jgi:hypothetical protein
MLYARFLLNSSAPLSLSLSHPKCVQLQKTESRRGEKQKNTKSGRMRQKENDQN